METINNIEDDDYDNRDNTCKTIDLGYALEEEVETLSALNEDITNTKDVHKRMAKAKAKRKGGNKKKCCRPFEKKLLKISGCLKEKKTELIDHTKKLKNKFPIMSWLHGVFGQ